MCLQTHASRQKASSGISAAHRRSVRARGILVRAGGSEELGLSEGNECRWLKNAAGSAECKQLLLLQERLYWRAPVLPGLRLVNCRLPVRTLFLGGWGRRVCVARV